MDGGRRPDWILVLVIAGPVAGEEREVGDLTDASVVVAI
jgi:hypothetical protein